MEIVHRGGRDAVDGRPREPTPKRTRAGDDDIRPGVQGRERKRVARYNTPAQPNATDRAETYTIRLVASPKSGIETQRGKEKRMLNMHGVCAVHGRYCGHSPSVEGTYPLSRCRVIVRCRTCGFTAEAVDLPKVGHIREFIESERLAALRRWMMHA